MSLMLQRTMVVSIRNLSQSGVYLCLGDPGAYPSSRNTIKHVGTRQRCHMKLWR